MILRSPIVSLLISMAFVFMFVQDVASCAREVSIRESELLTLVVGSEARGRDEGAEYVIYVILNRVAHPRWPNTIEGVVTQPRQFARAHLRSDINSLLNHPNRIERTAWRRINDMVGEVVCGDNNTNPLPDVYHFIAPSVFDMKMSKANRKVVDVGTGPRWALGMYVHPVSDGLKHWFLTETPIQ